MSGLTWPTSDCSGLPKFDRATVLLDTGLARVATDLLFDWAVVLAAVMLTIEGSPRFTPFAIVLTGNRQRALGNILHDAGHRNLSRTTWINDVIANLFLAPPLLTSLTHYRASHFAHHAVLGDAVRDPDFIALANAPGTPWWIRYAQILFSRERWIGSVLGHLADPDASMRDKVGMLTWWAALLCCLGLTAGGDVVLAFIALWFGARATVFHLITTFREMCDHVGLQPGGIFSFTRDVSSRGLWRCLVHPHNNGYHQTHHLCPAGPYHRLPQAHELFRQMPTYRERGIECDAYFTGARAVKHGWSGGCAA